MPAVSMAAVRASLKRDLDADFGDVVYFSKVLEPRHEFLTANNQTPYVLRGALFRGNQHYRLRVPADTPAHDFWSIIAYEVATNAFIHNPENRVGVSSYDKQQMAVNPDGSVDVYLGPTAPDGLTNTWIPTAGKDFWLIARFYVVISVAALREPRWYIVQIGDMFDEIVYNIGGSRGPEPDLFCLTGPDYHGPIPANYSIGSTTDGLKTDADGSITIYIQHENPGADKQSNWLPAPAAEFNLTMRLYGAESPILDRSYRLPAVTRPD